MLPSARNGGQGLEAVPELVRVFSGFGFKFRLGLLLRPGRFPLLNGLLVLQFKNQLPLVRDVVLDLLNSVRLHLVTDSQFI